MLRCLIGLAEVERYIHSVFVLYYKYVQSTKSWLPHSARLSSQFQLRPGSVQLSATKLYRVFLSLHKELRIAPLLLTLFNKFA